MGFRDTYIESPMLFLQDLGITSATRSSGSRSYSANVKGVNLKGPSVTTIISKYEPKGALMAWKEKLGAEADVISRQCANIGTKVHKCNECFFDKSSYEVSEPEVLTRHRLFLPFLQKIEPIFLEQKIFWCNKHNHAFGGTADVIGTISSCTKDLLFTDLDRTLPFEGLPVGAVFAGDYKNFLSAKTPDRLLSKYLQAAAYAIAVEYMTGGQVSPKHGLVIGTTKTMLNVFHLDAECMGWYKFWFLKLIDCYFNNRPFDWKSFAEASGGYELNPDYVEGGDEPKWKTKEKNYLSTKLYTPKQSKQDLENLNVPYIQFTSVQ
jgi:hypothetical protein